MKQRSLQQLISVGLFPLLLLGCNATATTHTPVVLPPTATTVPSPTAIPSPASTSTPSLSPTASLTPLPTATLALPLTVGTPIPQPSTIISPDNANSIVEMARWVGHACSVFSLNFSPDSQMLASTSCDQTVRVWGLASGNQLGIMGQPGVEFDTAFSPDGATLAAWSNDKTINLYEVASGSVLRTFEHAAELWGAAISPDGKTLAAGGADGTVTLWNLADGSELPSLSANLGKKYGVLLFVGNVAFSPDGMTLASADEDGKLRLWDLASGKVMRSIQIHDPFSVSFSMDGSMLVVETFRSYNGGSNQEFIVTLYDVASGSRLRSFSGIPDEGHDSALSPDGRTLAVGVGTYKAGVPASDGAIVLYDVASGRELIRLTGHTDRVDSVAFSPDGRFIASGSGDGDRTIRLWGIYP